MKKILLILACALAPTFVHAQISDSSYTKIPWKSCFQFYKNFNDIYKYFPLDSVDNGYTKAQILKCPGGERLFVYRDFTWREIFFPKELLKEKFTVYNIIAVKENLEVKFFTDNGPRYFRFLLHANSWEKFEKEETWGHSCDNEIK